MDIKEFMDKDLQFIDSIVHELSENITRWDTDKVFEKAKEMFDAFSRRFALEDCLLCQIVPNVDIRPGIKTFLKRRLEFREKLEDILNLHVDEPDFREAISSVLESVHKHMKYREEEFYPQVINRLSAADLERMSQVLEKKLIQGSLV